jgi:hypothetical protein
MIDDEDQADWIGLEADLEELAAEDPEVAAAAAEYERVKQQILDDFRRKTES